MWSCRPVFETELVAVQGVCCAVSVMRCAGLGWTLPHVHVRLNQSHDVQTLAYLSSSGRVA
jgi:hypothetical protein